MMRSAAIAGVLLLAACTTTSLAGGARLKDQQFGVDVKGTPLSRAAIAEQRWEAPPMVSLNWGFVSYLPPKPQGTLKVTLPLRPGQQNSSSSAGRSA